MTESPTPPTPAVGTIWLIHHARKGQFVARIVKDDGGAWLDLEITEGRAYYLANRIRRRGDTLTVLRSLVTFLEDVTSHYPVLEAKP